MDAGNTTTTPELKNPLDGLNKQQVKQLGRAIQRANALAASLEKAQKALQDSRFMVKAGLNAKETARAVAAARASEKTTKAAEDALAKLADKFKDNAPITRGLALYQELQRGDAAGNLTARNLLKEVDADIVIATATTAVRAKAATETGEQTPEPKTSLDSLLNGIAAGKTQQKEPRTAELTEHARGEAETALNERKRREPNELQEPARYPASLLARYTLRGNEVINKRTEEVAFVDDGRELRAKGDVGKDIIDAMLDTAASRGWAPIKVFGTQAFKAAIWMEAASRGMDVTGYKPSPQEELVAAQNRAINGPANRIEAGTEATKAKQEALKDLTPAQELAKAFQDATTVKLQAKAAKQFPELGQAFALLAAFQKGIAQPGLSRQESKDFTEQFKDLIASRLESGKPLPTVEVREKVQEKQQQTEDQEK